MSDGSSFLSSPQPQDFNIEYPIKNFSMKQQSDISLVNNGPSKPPKSYLSTIAYVGTLSYMSPERLEGKEYSFSSDIWALGMIVYEVVTG